MRRIALAAATLSLAATAARGQAAPPLQPDPGSIWTLQDENSSISANSLTDRYYVNGIRLGYTSGTDTVPVWLSDIDQAVWGAGQQRFSVYLTQQIFTPAETATYRPLPGDRPYAGVLLGTLSLLEDTSDSRSLLALSVGVVGPSALAEQVQNGFHDVIGQGHTNGWHYQVEDQPAVNLLAQRTWRLPLVDLGPLETDALPSLTGAAGDVRDYFQVGSVFRLGQGLNSDFGTARIEPGLNGSDAFTQTAPLVWYVFGGADGQAVGYDVTLDGSTFRSNSPSVPRIWDVGELEGGLAVIWHGVHISYTQTWQTQEFRGAHSGLFSFGSLTASVKF
jgi:hypothetical protein